MRSFCVYGPDGLSILVKAQSFAGARELVRGHYKSRGFNFQRRVYPSHGWGA